MSIYFNCSLLIARSMAEVTKNHHSDEYNGKNYPRRTSFETDTVNQSSQRKLRQIASISRSEMSKQSTTFNEDVKQTEPELNDDTNTSRRSLLTKDINGTSLQISQDSFANKRPSTFGDNKNTVESEDTSRIEELNKRIGSKSACTSSKLRHSGILTNDTNSASNPKEISTGSLIQIARNKTQSKVRSTHQHVLSQIADISSSSSDEIGLHNQDDANNDFISEENYVIKNASTRPSDTKKGIESVSGNTIDKIYDASCQPLSTLGIVSYRNKLSNISEGLSEARNNSSLTKSKKRVSVSYPTPLDNPSDIEPQYDSISGAALLSVDVPSLCVLNPSNPPEHTKVISSASKYKVDNVYEHTRLENVEGNLSNLGLVSDKCALRSNISHATPDKVLSTLAADKMSQSDNCECWKICTCRLKSESPTIRHEHVTCEQNPAITCIIANNGLIPKRYTASYTFSYENLHANQVSNSKN